MFLVAASVAQPWYLDPVFLPAATGFIGVLVGAIITAVSSYWLDEKRDERERCREQSNRRIEAKRSARMIDLDLEQAETFAAIALKDDHYWSPYHAPLKMDGWSEYKRTITTELNDDPWLQVRRGVKAIMDLNQYRDMDTRAPGVDSFFPAISSEFSESVAMAVEDIRAARRALAPLCSEASPVPS